MKYKKTMEVGFTPINLHLKAVMLCRAKTYINQQQNQHYLIWSEEEMNDMLLI